VIQSVSTKIKDSHTEKDYILSYIDIYSQLHQLSLSLGEEHPSFPLHQFFSYLKYYIPTRGFLNLFQTLLLRLNSTKISEQFKEELLNDLEQNPASSYSISDEEIAESLKNLEKKEFKERFDIQNAMLDIVKTIGSLKQLWFYRNMLSQRIVSPNSSSSHNDELINFEDERDLLADATGTLILGTQIEGNYYYDAVRQAMNEIFYPNKMQQEIDNPDEFLDEMRPSIVSSMTQAYFKDGNAKYACQFFRQKLDLFKHRRDKSMNKDAKHFDTFFLNKKRGLTEDKPMDKQLFIQIIERLEAQNERIEGIEEFDRSVKLFLQNHNNYESLPKLLSYLSLLQEEKRLKRTLTQTGNLDLFFISFRFE
jgi:hypothetical protein